jgi:hypothetical protein
MDRRALPLRAGRLALSAALGMLLGVGLLLTGCYYYVPPPYAAPAPPPGAVLVPGQWVWNGAAWVWRPPYWAAPNPAPPPGAAPPAGAPPPAPAPPPG